MENFCKIGKFERKEGYDVCRDVNQKGELRYDLTLIYPNTSTFGHYHTDDKPELYEILSGKACFIIQKYDSDPSIITDAYLVETEEKEKEKEKVIIPPRFSMTTINPQKDEELLEANWVDKNVQNDYEAFKKLGGACYSMKDGIIQKNDNYKKIPVLIKLKPKKIPEELENLEFLSIPEKYKNILTIDNLYSRGGEIGRHAAFRAL